MNVLYGRFLNTVKFVLSIGGSVFCDILYYTSVFHVLIVSQCFMKSWRFAGDSGKQRLLISGVAVSACRLSYPVNVGGDANMIV